MNNSDNHETATNKHNSNEILKVKDLMKELHYGKNKIYELLRTGKIKSIRVGRKYLVPRKAVDRFIDEQLGLDSNE